MPRAVRVLVVDDHPVIRELLSQVFGGLGCKVSTARDGDEALATLADFPFDMVCLDRHMPGISGDEVAARLPADRFLVAHSTDLADLPARFNHILPKPVTSLDAVVALQAALAWRAAAHAAVQARVA